MNDVRKACRDVQCHLSPGDRCPLLAECEKACESTPASCIYVESMIRRCDELDKNQQLFELRVAAFKAAAAFRVTSLSPA